MKTFTVNKTFANQITLSASYYNQVGEYFYFFDQNDDPILAIQASRVGSIEREDAAVKGHA